MEKGKTLNIVKWMVIGLLILMVSEWESTKKAINDAFIGVYAPPIEIELKK